MELNNNGRTPNGAPIKNQSKGSYSCTPLQTIRRLLLGGGVYAARELNRLTHSNDARKCISTLRHSPYNMKIVDKWQKRPKVKLYWLENVSCERRKEPIQLDLFSDEQSTVSSSESQQTAENEPQQIGEVMNELEDSPIFDKESGEYNIMALWKRRKGGQYGKE